MIGIINDPERIKPFNSARCNLGIRDKGNQKEDHNPEWG